MTKTHTQYVCQQCGRTTARPLGRCPQCGAWNSMLAEIAPATSHRGPRPTAGAIAHRLSEVETHATDRLPVSLGEFARVLGGGIVAGSVVLIGGDPGIGKSTLLLQLALALAEERRVLYVSAEEAERQVKARALRLTPAEQAPSNLFLLAETDLESILRQIDQLAPELAIVDSIQAVSLQELEGGAGSITQVRECAARLVAAAKSSGTAVFLVGHVTKEGAIAGPRVLEHMVDTVLYLEGDQFHAYRLLRAVKNRFGATSEVGVFEMRSAGLAEVPNPSEVFLAERAVNAPGSAVAVTIQGARPLLVEVQGLSSPSSFGHPRRTANGVDLNRLLLTVAVLQRRVGVHLAEQDVFVNVVGGMRIDEPGVDLAIAAALASSARDRAIAAEVALIGEIGLSGEVRSVPQLEVRLKEAGRLGFRRVIIPWSLSGEVQPPAGLTLLPARTLREALALLDLSASARSAQER